MVINAITIISLLILVFEMLFVVINVFLKQRAERITFIRSLKKGKCAIIYITAIPLYCVGHMYNGQDFFKAFFGAVNKIINLVVLKYDTGSIDSLMSVNSIYKFTVYFLFFLVGINALLFTFSLTGQHIWCAVNVFKTTVSVREKLFIFGNNDENIGIYNSDKKHAKAVVDNISEKEREKLYLKKIVFVDPVSNEAFIKKIFSRIDRFNGQYILVINTGDDEQNMSLCRNIIDNIKAMDDKNKLFFNLRVYVFGDDAYEAIYVDIVSNAYGCIEYTNKYQKIAVDFIDKYPLSQFMGDAQVDYGTSLVRDGVDINVLMIGFGKTNQQIFLTSVANNQFLTNSINGPVLKPVKYHIFDKDTSDNKNLNHSYYRYQSECHNLNVNEYLPLPSVPAEEVYYKLNVNSIDFYNRICSIVTNGPVDVNFIIIAFGTDLENIDMAKKIADKCREWGVNNLLIFVKVRTLHRQQNLLEIANCYFIGNEQEIVYDIEKITCDKLSRMAKMRNEMYDLEYALTKNNKKIIDAGFLRQQHIQSTKDWYIKKSNMERESSVYCCLSLRSKLNLMGLDYCVETTEDVISLTNKEYLEIYAYGDMPVEKFCDNEVYEKPIISYTLDFKHSRRGNMAIQEHQRWNSFMISKGMIPSSIEQIRDERKSDGTYTNGKNYSVRRHGNLTTFAGLAEFRKIVATRDRKDEAEADVIKYDYQLLDDAYWLLRKCGYKIIKKKN